MTDTPDGKNGVFTLPSELMAALRAIAEEKHCTLDDVVREAWEHYKRTKQSATLPPEP